MTDKANQEPPKVFINCPFDPQFEPLRDALIVSCVACGFFPTSAVVKGGGGRLRIDRILDELETSLYSIHDMSRSTGAGQYNLARFNMPLELGMAIYLSRANGGQHDWLALVPDGPAHAAYISDLSGFDPEVYDGTEAQMISRVVSYLAVRDEAVPGIGARLVCDVMPSFRNEKSVAVEKWNGQAPPWVDLVEAARRALVSRVGQ